MGEERNIEYKDDKNTYNWTFKEAETIGEYLAWEIPIEAGTTESLWRVTQKTQIAMINAMMVSGPKIDEKMSPKVLKFLVKKLKDFLE